MNSELLLDKYPIISDQISKNKLKVILKLLDDVIQKDTPGDITEFGCYIGTTSLFLQRVVQNTKKKLYVYDSFEGLPEKTIRDLSGAGQQFKKGELKSTKAQFCREFKNASLKLPIIKKSWFNELTDEDLPVTICLAFLDGDFFESIFGSLKLTWHKLPRGGIIIIDDFTNESLPGASRAAELFFRDKIKSYSHRTEAGLGIFQKNEN